MSEQERMDWPQIRFGVCTRPPWQRWQHHLPSLAIARGVSVSGLISGAFYPGSRMLNGAQLTPGAWRKSTSALPFARGFAFPWLLSAAVCVRIILSFCLIGHVRHENN